MLIDIEEFRRIRNNLRDIQTELAESKIQIERLLHKLKEIEEIHDTNRD